MNGAGSKDFDDWRTTFRPDIPSPARIYDYLLGGKDNYPADRQAGDEIATHLPNIRQAFGWNRIFLQRAVRFLINEAGIRQLIDIGTGLPAAGNVHDVATQLAPAARIVYVDNDPVVLAHGRDMLHGLPSAVILEHDLRSPAHILADPELRRLIDFDEPVAILLVAVLHFIADADDPWQLVDTLRDALAPGSYLVLGQGTNADKPSTATAFEKVYNSRSATAIQMRSQAEILRFFGDFELVDPGLVYVSQWPPDSPGDVPANPSVHANLVAVARKT